VIVDSNYCDMIIMMITIKECEQYDNLGMSRNYHGFNSTCHCCVPVRKSENRSDSA